MPTYEYRARDKSGQVRQGTIFASTPLEATRLLQEQGLVVVQLREQPPTAPTVFFRTSAKPLAIFFRHLHNTYRAGVPLGESLEVFANTERSPLRSVAAHAAKRLREGVPLSQALRETRFPFPVFVLPLIEAGERGGHLDRIFAHLAEHFEREAQFEQEMKRGTIFAKAYLGCAVGAMLLVLGIASSLGAANPLVLGTRSALRLLGVLVGLWLVWRILAMTRWTAPYIDLIILHLPFVSAPWRKLMAVRFARTLALLYSAGVAPHTSLELAAQATGSPFIVNAAQKLTARLQRGEKFTQVVSEMPFLPPLVVQMLATGEKAGSVDETLHKAAEFLESEAQTGMKVLPIVAGFALYGFVLLLLVWLIFQGMGIVATTYGSLFGD